MRALRRPVASFALWVCLFGFVGCDSCDGEGAAAERATVVVELEAAGMGAEEVEREVVLRLERPLLSLPGHPRVLARSAEGAASLSVELEAAPDDAQRLVREAVDAIRDLPEDVGPPVFTSRLASRVRVEVVAPAEGTVADALAALPSDERPETVVGGSRGVVFVDAPAERLRAHELSAAEVVLALTGRAPDGPPAPTTLDEVTEREIRPGLAVGDLADIRVGRAEGPFARSDGRDAAVLLHDAPPDAADATTIRARGELLLVEGPIAIVRVLTPVEGAESVMRIVDPLGDAARRSSGVRSVVALFGRGMEGALGRGLAELVVVADDPEAARAGAARIEETIAERPGLRGCASAQGDAYLRVTLRAATEAEVDRAEAALGEWLRSRRDVGCVWEGTGGRLGELRVSVTPEAAGHGVGAPDVARAVRLATSGVRTGQIQLGREPAEVRVRIPAGDRGRVATPLSLAGVTVPTPDGGEVPLVEVAELEQRLEPVQRLRVDGRPASELYVRVRGNASVLARDVLSHGPGSAGLPPAALDVDGPL